ncbi:hypothetical protein HIM_00704 [Hirsutella minnesotensis 3608]|nr:hypothetical protein HIM_00704 [Hirsutella minnesotensis 3608]
MPAHEVTSLCLARMMDSCSFSDLTISCNEEDFKVHKSVVCTHSKVIEAALLGDFEESRTNVIKMDSFELETVKRFIEFMYTGNYSDFDAIKASCLILEPMRSNSPLENTSGDSENCPNEANSPQSRQKSCIVDALMGHVHVNAIGHFYNVYPLEVLANENVEKLLNRNGCGLSWGDILPALIDAASELTGDEKLVEILAAACVRRCSDVAESGNLKNLDSMSSFSLALFKACAREIETAREDGFKTKMSVETLTKELAQKDADHKNEISSKDGEIALLTRPMATLAKTKRCRNCRADFKCLIEPGLLRCTECLCRHK